MSSKLTGMFKYFVPGVAILAVAMLLPVTLPSENDIFVPDSAQHYAITPFTRGVIVAQQFPAASGRIDAVTLVFGAARQTNTGTLRMEMRVNRDGAWKTLATQTVAQASLRDTTQSLFAFSPPLPVSAGEQCQIVVQADGAGTQGVWLYATPDGHPSDGYVLTISDAPQPGVAIFRVTYHRASGHVFQMLGRIWQRSTVLLSVRWQLVLGIALGVTLACIAALSRRLSPGHVPPPE